MNRGISRRTAVRIQWRLSVASVALLWSGSSWAQGAVEDIVVTARRREETVQDVPVSVTAFSPNELKDRGTREIDDLLTTIPNVTPANGLQIRGIGYSTRNIGIEAGATVYVDGVYTGRPDSFNQDLADVARVEVLRGPQGTLFGKNSIAGVISITTNTPKFERQGELFGEYGNQGIRRVQIIANEPLGEAIAVRGSFTKASNDGWILNNFDGSKFGDSDLTALRGSILFQPSPDLKITLRADTFKRAGQPRGTETLLGDDPQTLPPRAIVSAGPFITMEDTFTVTWNKLRGGSATIDYDGIGDVKLTSITAYRHNSSLLNEGQDDSARNMIEVNFFDSQKQFSQEFRAAGQVGDLDYVAGLYYFHQRSRQSNQGILGTGFAIPPLGIPGGVKKIIDPQAYIKTRSFAAFLDLTYKITDQLELQAGGRFGVEKKNFEFQIQSDAPALFYVVPFGTDSFKDNDFSPTFGLRYHFTRDVMAYARYAKGYKSGGWNADFVSTKPATPPPTIRSLRFEAETATTYEAGLKTELFDRHVVFNFSAFYTDFTNLQVAQFFGINLEDPNNQLAVTANAGSARIKGFEVETRMVPFTGLTLTGGLGYQHAKYLKFENIDGKGTNADGFFMAGVPKWTLNGSVDYTHRFENDSALSFRLDYSRQAGNFGDPLNTPIRRNPAYGTLNGRITYAAPDGDWQVSLWSRNLGDDLYVTSYGIQRFAVAQSSPVRTVSYGRPRTYGLEVRIRY